MCGVRDVAQGLSRTRACVHNMKKDGRFLSPAHTEPSEKGACRWYVATVSVWFGELHALLNEHPGMKWDDAARAATLKTQKFDTEFRNKIRARRVGNAALREIANEQFTAQIQPEQ